MGRSTSEATAQGEMVPQTSEDPEIVEDPVALLKDVPESQLMQAEQFAAEFLALVLRLKGV